MRWLNDVKEVSENVRRSRRWAKMKFFSAAIALNNISSVRMDSLPWCFWLVNLVQNAIVSRFLKEVWNLNFPYLSLHWKFIKIQLSLKGKYCLKVKMFPFSAMTDTCTCSICNCLVCMQRRRWSDVNHVTTEWQVVCTPCYYWLRGVVILAFWININTQAHSIPALPVSSEGADSMQVVKWESSVWPKRWRLPICPTY